MPPGTGLRDHLRPSLQSTLRNGLERRPVPSETKEPLPVQPRNIRGADYLQPQEEYHADPSDI